ncbi:MAG TPA: DUF389 domain-containing protein [Humibacter sp.]|jgi:uncharacterized hydrophobic protein (TIGR00271 family)|nr:DUF389 domain-containing protein [Humibacter sp.]
MDVTPQPIENSIDHMRDAVFFDGIERSHRLSRFWTLLVLASVIAAAGVVAQSTATVIGAMIVAPMMIPIQGAMLSTVLADRANLLRSVALIVGGALTAVAIGFVVGLADPVPVVAATNSEVAGRVSPGLIDMLAALATGVVASIALVRRDISDTLPGVAISISLVPPLSVVGLTLESASFDEALGALLLFVTNVAAILATGVVVMTIYRVRGDATLAVSGMRRAAHPRRAVIVIVAMLLVVVVPLTFSTVSFVQNASSSSILQTVAGQWGHEHGWDVVSVATGSNGATLRLTGPLPVPSMSDLKSDLRSAGFSGGVRVELVPSVSKNLDVSAG